MSQIRALVSWRKGQAVGWRVVRFWRCLQGMDSQSGGGGEESVRMPSAGWVGRTCARPHAAFASTDSSTDGVRELPPPRVQLYGFIASHDSEPGPRASACIADRQTDNCEEACLSSLQLRHRRRGGETEPAARSA